MADSFDGYKEILDDLKNRSEWDLRQSLWYRLRHSMIGRQRLPYPNAPDMRFPLIDSLIDRLKAFYFQQLYSTATLASFISLKPQDDELTTACGGWFDYRLKQKSNFERAMLSTIDHMLQSGFCPLKNFWDEQNKRVTFKPRNPIHFIVPKGTVDLNDAWRVVDVLHLSVEDYKRNKNFNQDEAFRKRITGKGTGQAGSSRLEDDKLAREGLTIGTGDDEILLWEIYNKQSDSILVSTYSPLVPDEKVRDDFTLPYDKGEFANGKTFPFSIYQMEVKDEGLYSPRGLPELLAQFQSSMNKMWNMKHEWMDFFNRPVYTSDKDVGNLSNIQAVPGQVLPPNLTPQQAPHPPVSTDEEMQTTRGVAEYRANIPDLGAGQHLTQGKGSKGEVTATQINAIVGQSGIADDMRVRVFRLGLQQSYRQAWSIYLQYDQKSMDYIVQSEVSQLDKSSLHSDYIIMPNGSVDSWNKGVQQQKAYQRLTSYANNPYIGQDELVKSTLELDDPGLVRRLFRDPGLTQLEQQTKQSMETLLMLNNFGAPVDPSDDDKTHLQGVFQFGQARMQEQNPIGPITAQLLGQHIQGHLQGLATKKDKALGQFQKQAQPFLQMLQQIAASPPNVVQMPGMSQQQPQQAQQEQPQGKEFDPVADAAKMLSSYASMAKAGQPVGIEQINAILVPLGIPPIVVAPQPSVA